MVIQAKTKYLGNKLITIQPLAKFYTLFNIRTQINFEL